MYKIRSCDTISVVCLRTNFPFKAVCFATALRSDLWLLWRTHSGCFLRLLCTISLRTPLQPEAWELQLPAESPGEMLSLVIPLGPPGFLAVLMSSFYQRFTRAVKTALTPHVAEAQLLLFLHHQLEFLFAEIVGPKVVSPLTLTFREVEQVCTKDKLSFLSSGSQSGCAEPHPQPGDRLLRLQAFQQSRLLLT